MTYYFQILRNDYVIYKSSEYFLFSLCKADLLNFLEDGLIMGEDFTNINAQIFQNEWKEIEFHHAADLVSVLEYWI